MACARASSGWQWPGPRDGQEVPGPAHCQGIGAGFLLKKLQYSYGERFGIGMGEQVAQCINDINQIERSRALRTASTTKEQKA
jgi:hypothetical protein